jgi:hypothetical protein
MTGKRLRAGLKRYQTIQNLIDFQMQEGYSKTEVVILQKTLIQI